MSGDHPHLAFATLARGVDLPLVRSLVGDLSHHHPGAPIHVLHLGEEPVAGDPATSIAGTTSVRPEELGLAPDPLSLARLVLDPEALGMALGPLLAAHVARTTGHSTVWLSADTAVLGPFGPADDDAIGLAPRFRDLPTDNRTPTAEDLAALSLFDGGYLRVPPSIADAVDGLARLWWQDAPPDQAAITHAWTAQLLRLPHCLVDDEGMGLAYWNLWERPRVATAPDITGVRTLRLPGFDPDRPHVLSVLQGTAPRVLVSELPAIGPWLQDHAARLRALGVHGIGDDTIGDLLVDRYVRSAIRHALAGDAEEADAAAQAVLAGSPALDEWLAEAPAASHDPDVSRYLLGVWASDDHARAHFANPSDDQAEAFLDWVSEAAPTLGIAPAFLPSPARPVGSVARATLTENIEPGVNLVGFLRAGFGIGEATRLFAHALEADGIPHAAISVSHDDLRDMIDRDGVDEEPIYDINLVCVNVDWLDLVRRRLGHDFMEGRYSIGTWWWESNVLPERLARQLGQFDELWVGSNFIADALRSYTDMPIRVFPLPVLVPPEAPAPDRQALGLPEGFLFMFSFDFNSTVERKNPAGVIESFCRAFEPGEGPSLVIKSINGHRHLLELEGLRALASGRPDIQIVDRFLPAAERDAWARACDCYVSLHRSEGFGLTMAEAMALGKPVIATGYSANLDFMDHKTALLVGYEEWVLQHPSGPYPAGTIWADPNLDEVAAFMRDVAADPSAAHALGQRARTHIATTRTAGALARFVRNRLEEIRMNERHSHDRPLDEPLPGPLQDAANYDAERRSAGGPAPDRLARRMVKPYSASADALFERLMTSDQWLFAHGEQRMRALERRLDALEQSTRRLTTITDAVRPLAIDANNRIAGLEDELYAELFMDDPSALTIQGPDGALVLGYDHHMAPLDSRDRYADFEDVFRGSPDRVMGELGPYVELLREHAPVLDIGCGKGEMLELLQNAGISARGIDSDPGMINRGAGSGLDMAVGDATAFLENEVEPGSLGAIFCSQVIEHLPWRQLQQFLELAHGALQPGGLLIAETVNPHCLRALKAFWLDPTHQHPLFPEALLVFCRQAGFAQARIRFTGASRELETARRESDSYAVIATRRP